MARVPKGMTLEESESITTIKTSNYNQTLLMMQIILMLIPLSLICGFLIFMEYYDRELFVFGALLLLVVYWLIYNVNDNYIVYIGPINLKIVRGMHRSKLVDVALIDIKRVKIKRKYGSIYTSRYGATSETGNSDELIIVTDQAEILVTSSLLYSEQLYLKDKISERITNSAI